MLHRKIATVVITTLLCLTLAACGSGGGYGGGASTVLSVDGIYYGALNLGSSMSSNNNLAGAVGPSGQAYLFSTGAQTSNVLVFTSISTTGVVSSNLTDIPSSNVGGSPSSASWSVSVVQNPTQDGNDDQGQYGSTQDAPLYSITGTGKIGGTAENFSMSYEVFSDTAMPLASLAGSYQGSDITRVTDATMTVSAGGVLSGTDGLGCTLSGSLTQDPNKDVFVVSITITGSAACPGSMTGVAFLTNDDLSGAFSGAAGSYLYIISTNSGLTAASTMELKLQ